MTLPVERGLMTPEEQDPELPGQWSPSLELQPLTPPPSPTVLQEDKEDLPVGVGRTPTATTNSAPTIFGSSGWACYTRGTNPVASDVMDDVWNKINDPHDAWARAAVWKATRTSGHRSTAGARRSGMFMRTSSDRAWWWKFRYNIALRGRL